MGPREESATRRSRVWILVVLILVLLGVAGRVLPVDLWLEVFNGWVARLGPVGLVLYAAVYAAAAVLFVPGSVLTIGAGFVFGILWGTAAVSVGSTVGAALAFLIARYFARERVAEIARRDGRFVSIDDAIGREGWKIVLLLRLSPLIPFNVSNYLYGLTAVPFWPYVASSWIGMLPGTVLYAYLGFVGRTSLEAASGERASQSSLETLFLAVGLLATIVVTWYVSRVARSALQKSKLQGGSE